MGTMGIDYGQAGQQARPTEEQAMPDYMRAELDRRRAKLVQDRLEHPAIMDALDEVHKKLNMIFSKLMTK